MPFPDRIGTELAAIGAVSPYILLVCLWPLLFLVVWAVWNSVRDSRDEKLFLRGLEWPEAKGTVKRSRVAWAHVEVSYEYSVEGIRYTGKYKMSLAPVVPDRYGKGAARMNKEATEDIADFPPGQAVVIRYNPSRPDESVLYCKGEPGRTDRIGGRGVAPEFRTLE